MIALKRYTIRALEYQHLDESQLIQDFRSNKQVKSVLINIHYVGFEIRTTDQTLYHHAAILSDSLESLCEGIASIRLHLGLRFQNPDMLTLVFLRSYLTVDPDVVDHKSQYILREEMEMSIRSRRIYHFMAYGLQSDGVIQDLRVQANNAIEAYGQLQKNTYKLDVHNKLTFLGAYSAHPVTAEYTEHFDYAEDRLRLMIEETEEWKTCAIN
ncbi:MAG: hypothetical protein ACYCY8_06585 [Burkholderiales bacterium]